MAIDDHTRKSYDKTDKIYGSDETGLKPIQQVRIHFHRLDFPADFRRKSKRWIKNDRLKQQVEETGQSHGRKADREKKIEKRRSGKEDQKGKAKSLHALQAAKRACFKAWKRDKQVNRSKNGFT